MAIDHIKKQAIKQFLQNWQSEMIELVSVINNQQPFELDSWKYQSGQGGGLTATLYSDDLIESAGVNFSHIYGESLPNVANNHAKIGEQPFEAMGTSIVIHPNNPFAPTTHANLRFIQVTPSQKPAQWWFGGGFDLTPYYAFEEDIALWHQHAKSACDSLDSSLYPQFKQQCDEYFYLPHRDERRGIGGIFFENLNSYPLDSCLSFIESVGMHFKSAYETILSRRLPMPWNTHHKTFQHYRRGRYVEFNLLYDRGTHFGLQSGGRTESILMSLPPTVSWRYQLSDEIKKDEANLLRHLQKKISD